MKKLMLMFIVLFVSTLSIAQTAKERAEFAKSVEQIMQKSGYADVECYVIGTNNSAFIISWDGLL